MGELREELMKEVKERKKRNMCTRMLNDGREKIQCRIVIEASEPLWT